MLKKSVFAICAFVFLIMFSSLSFANTIELYNSYGTTNGGEFIAVTDNLGTFDTFCLEKDEFITYEKQYEYLSSSAAVEGGVGGPEPDPISIGTAYLFYNFLYNPVSIQYTYTTDTEHETKANALQEAIWYLEQEINSINSENTFFNQVALLYQNPMLDSNGAYPVAVLNLYGDNPTTETTNETDANLQSVLAPVPIPAAVWLFGSGLLGLFGIKRRMSR